MIDYRPCFSSVHFMTLDFVIIISLNNNMSIHEGCQVMKNRDNVGAN